MNLDILYESPTSEVIEIETEGLICGSFGNENVGEEEGNGSFEIL